MKILNRNATLHLDLGFIFNEAQIDKQQSFIQFIFSPEHNRTQTLVLNFEQYVLHVVLFSENSFHNC